MATLFETDLDNISESDLLNLVENQVREDYRIEYKRHIDFAQKQDKIDFLGSVSAFANSGGGDVLVGIEPRMGCRFQSRAGLSTSIPKKVDWRTR